jgi:hypothetical protein
MEPSQPPKHAAYQAELPDKTRTAQPPIRSSARFERANGQSPVVAQPVSLRDRSVRRRRDRSARRARVDVEVARVVDRRRPGRDRRARRIGRSRRRVRRGRRRRRSAEEAIFGRHRRGALRRGRRRPGELRRRLASTAASGRRLASLAARSRNWPRAGPRWRGRAGGRARRRRGGRFAIPRLVVRFRRGPDVEGEPDRRAEDEQGGEGEQEPRAGCAARFLPFTRGRGTTQAALLVTAERRAHELDEDVGVPLHADELLGGVLARRVGGDRDV